MDLLTFVMHYSYLSFNNAIYHQIDGTAMGTAVAPTYANIVVYMLERSVIKEFSENIYLYRRFLDDIFAYVSPTHAIDFQKRMNELHPKLRFEFISHPTEADFLDLTITKGKRFNTDGRFDLSVHQKKMNLYLYIPFRSYHTDAAKRSFILTELMRYIRNSSDCDSYLRLKHIFYQRLRDRGYPPSFLLPIFNNIYWCDRMYFLYDSEKKSPLSSHPDIDCHPPESQCLLRRLHRSRLQSITKSSSRPPVFVIPYTPLSHRVPTRDILSEIWWMLPSILKLPKPIIAYQSYPSLVMRLVYQKARMMEKQQMERSKIQKTTQSKLRFPLISSPSTTRPSACISASESLPRGSSSQADIVPMDIDDNTSSRNIITASTTEE